MFDIHTICVHYDATYPDQKVRWKDIVAMHIKRGFRTGGYNWFIPKDASLEEGREEGSMTAGVTGHNSGVIHICWSGGLERRTGPNVGHWNINPAQEATLIRLIHGIQSRWPNARNVVGHINLGPSQCPGRDDVAAWWAEASKQPVQPSQPVTHGQPKFQPLGAQLDGWKQKFIAALSAFFERFRK